MRRIVAAITVPLAFAGAFGVLNTTGVASAAVSEYTSMSGPREVPGLGDVNALGRAAVTAYENTGKVCLTIRYRNVDPLTGAHIHEGGIDEAGPIVADFTRFIATGEPGVLKGCVFAPRVAAGLTDDASDYYVNVHNEAFPAGAMRGQLDNDR